MRIIWIRLIVMMALAVMAVYLVGHYFGYFGFHEDTVIMITGAAVGGFMQLIWPYFVDR